MTEHEQQLRRAPRASERFDISTIEKRIAEITPSPLGELIEGALLWLPQGPERAYLVRIKNLKQGTFDDLRDPEFQSFLVSYLRTDPSVLKVLTQILRTEYLAGSGSFAESSSLEMVARGDAATAPLTREELRAILSRRRY